MAMAPEAVCEIVWLNHGLADRNLVGGKGASLSQLAWLGAPVPPAFALTTDAYAAFAGSLALPQRSAEVTAADLPALRERIVAAAIPVSIANALAEGFATFQAMAGGETALAVRSSAVAEDSADHSFAGQHDSILDVRSLPALEAAVRQCWASLWTERSLAYRHNGDVVGDEAAIAVVVQQLIPSDVSFVAFTSDPLAGDGPASEERLVISASWGLGEAIVSGLVVPDHVVVDRWGTVVEYTIGNKQVMVIPGATTTAGTREVPVPRALRTMPALTHDQAKAIASMTRQLAPRLGYAADFEGAVADGKLYLLQARPITTLAPRLPIGSAAD